MRGLFRSFLWLLDSNWFILVLFKQRALSYENIKDVHASRKGNTISSQEAAEVAGFAIACMAKALLFTLLTTYYSGGRAGCYRSVI